MDGSSNYPTKTSKQCREATILKPHLQQNQNQRLNFGFI